MPWMRSRLPVSQSMASCICQRGDSEEVNGPKGAVIEALGQFSVADKQPQPRSCYWGYIGTIVYWGYIGVYIGDILG